MADGNGTPQTGNEGTPTTPTTPTFDETQQAFINKLFDNRFGKIQSKHADELKAKDDALAALQAEVEKLKNGTGTPATPAKKDEADPTKLQFEQLLKGEQAKTAQIAAQLEDARKQAETVKSENMRILKSNAMLESARKAANFHELGTVLKLTEDAIVYSEEHNGFVVMENGVVKNNASLQPMSLEEYFKGFAAERPYLVSGDVKPGAGSAESKHVNGLGVVRTKADLKTPADKRDYIKKFGLDAFEKLPLK